MIENVIKHAMNIAVAVQLHSPTERNRVIVPNSMLRVGVYGRHLFDMTGRLVHETVLMSLMSSMSKKPCKVKGTRYISHNTSPMGTRAFMDLTCRSSETNLLLRDLQKAKKSSTVRIFH